MTPRGRGNRSRRAPGGRKSASAVQAAVHRGPAPLLGRLGLWIGQRRPVGCRGLRLRPCVPGRDAAVQIARAADALGRGGELVDDRGVAVVLALLRAFDIAILAATYAEEVPFRPLAVAATQGFQGIPELLPKSFNLLINI